jgi:anti-anti-sigma regulatory factor
LTGRDSTYLSHIAKAVAARRLVVARSGFPGWPNAALRFPAHDHGMQQLQMACGVSDFGVSADSVRLSGDMDIYALPELERDFGALAGERVVIDMRDVRIISAAFIGALVRLRWRLPESRIVVSGANANVRRTFSAVGAEVLVEMA